MDLIIHINDDSINLFSDMLENEDFKKFTTLVYHSCLYMNLNDPPLIVPI